MRMKNVPPSGSVECCAESVMFAPRSNSQPETAATIPGRSGQTITSLAELSPVGSAAIYRDPTRTPGPPAGRTGSRFTSGLRRPNQSLTVAGRFCGRQLPRGASNDSQDHVRRSFVALVGALVPAVALADDPGAAVKADLTALSSAIGAAHTTLIADLSAVTTAANAGNKTGVVAAVKQFRSDRSTLLPAVQSDPQAAARPTSRPLGPRT